jgi:hypothetical protein
MSQLRIDPILEATLSPHDDKHGVEFEKMLVDHGEVFDPILTWRGLIVDGHHRFRVACKHKLPYVTKEVFPWCNTIEDIQYEMRRMQAYRRNLNPAQRSEQCVAIVNYLTGKGVGATDAVRQAANAAGVSERTAFRDIKAAKSVASSLTKLSPQVKSVAPHVKDKMHHKTLETLANLDHADQEAIVEKHDGDVSKIERELKRSRAVPPKQPDAEVFGDTDPRQSIRTQNDEARVAKRPLINSITDAMQALASLNKHIQACKSLGARQYNDCRFAMKQIDQVLEEWLGECEKAIGIK